MARELKGIVAAYIALLVYSTGALAEISKNESLISWKGVNGLSLNSYSNPNVSEACANFSICNNVNNYPTELAKWALEEMRKKFNIAKHTVEKIVIIKKEILQLCPSKEEIMFPTAALSKNGEWHFILNLPNQGFQGYYVNKCCNIPSSCNRVAGDSKCEQGYTERRMIYLNLRKQSVNIETFKVPSCCSCTAPVVF